MVCSPFSNWTRPSPQPFSIEDLPALGEECMRIMKITSAVHSAVYDFEKDVIRKVVRKRGAIEPLLNEMRLKLLELQQKENDGLLMLDKLREHGRSRHIIGQSSNSPDRASITTPD